MTEMHAYAASIMHFYEGKMIEINTGEIRTTHIMDQFEHDIQFCIRGVVREAYGDGVMIDVPLSNGQTKEVLVNAWSIINVSPMDGKDLSSVYWDADKKYNNK